MVAVVVVVIVVVVIVSWTPKNGPNVGCFALFYFQTRFVPQQRALFQPLNFQKCSEHGAACAFWLGHVLRATTPCTFSTAQLPKVLRTRQHLNFPKHWKNTVFRDSSTFSRALIFFLLTLSLLWSSFFFASLLWLFPPLLFHLSVLSGLGKIYGRDFLARCLQQMERLCIRSPQEVSWQDLCTRSL